METKFVAHGMREPRSKHIKRCPSCSKYV